MKSPNKVELSAANCGVDKSTPKEEATVTYEEKFENEDTALELDHDYDDAKSALSKLMEIISKDVRLVSAGIGLKAEDSDFVLKLEISDAEQKNLIPETVNGIEVQTIVGVPIMMQGLDIDE